MSKQQAEAKRLPRNFHKTFKPERQYINAMLKFAAAGKSGELKAISAETGIPMGESSGKAPAILDYCRGMGLVRLSPKSPAGIKTPELTPFGRIVLLEDPFLKETVTQWIAHFNLCNSKTGAETWYQVFFVGVQNLGPHFTRDQLKSHLQLIFNTQSQKKLIGPLIGMYEEESVFKACGALYSDNKTISRGAAPVLDELARGYGAWILQLIYDYFPGLHQISSTDLDKTAGWKTIPGWSVSSSIDLLKILEQKAMISVDRHMDPWLIQPVMTQEEAWRNVYADMI